MVKIEDKDRLVELVKLFRHEARDSYTSYIKLIGAEDAALLRRSEARLIESRPGEGEVYNATFHYKGCTFRQVYMIADKVAGQSPAGLPC